MNELELLTSLRDEVPLTDVSPAVEDTVLAAIMGSADSAAGPLRLAGRGAAGLAGAAHPSAGGPRVRRRGLRVAAAVAAAVAVGAAGFIGFAASGGPGRPSVIAWSGRPTALSADPVYPGLGRARTEAQLVDFATRAATISPGRAPGPHDWIFVKTEAADSSAGSGGFLFGPPDRRIINLNWIRADWRQYASLNVHVHASLPASAVVHGKIQISPGGGGTLGGWKSIRYSYLRSLPTDPARLESVILADNKPRMPWYVKSHNVAIFSAISTLLQGETEGAWIPPKLAATMYRVLRLLPGVHFEAGTDLAGRSGIGLYMVIDGWYKQELVINPDTYTFMGAKTVAVKAHVDVATDGTRHIRKGQVLGWQALLESAIVRHPGQLP
jgi:hypothetical protein